MRKLIRVTKFGALVAFLASGFVFGTAQADDASVTGLDDDWGAVSSEDLGETRGGYAIAVGHQDTDQTIEGSATSGNIDMDGLQNSSSFSPTIVNTGNNVTLLNVLAVDVCLDCTVYE